MKQCSVVRCENGMTAKLRRGMCQMHYRRSRFGLLPLDAPKLERHHMKHSPEYSSWLGMKERCSNPNHRSYARYGGRGISVCDRWKQSFTAFLSDMGPRPKGCTIDRVDGNSDYEPSNCRWASVKVQSINKVPSGLSASGKVGVYWRAGRWIATITVNHKRVRLGRFVDKADAIAARLKGEREYFEPVYAEELVSSSRPNPNR